MLLRAGPIPKELGALKKLEELWLHRNQLTGKEGIQRVNVVAALPYVLPAYAWVKICPGSF